MKFKNNCVVILVVCFSLTKVNSQNKINSVDGYSPHIGVMVNMLEDLRARITDQVNGLNQSEVDFLFDENANSIGALVMHLAATEAYYQVETIEGRVWTNEEEEFWSVAIDLKNARIKLKGKPITYYLNLWDEVRQKTLAGLKSKDDSWFAANIDEEMNNHWAWFHILEHSANHMGQIALVKNRMPQ